MPGVTPPARSPMTRAALLLAVVVLLLAPATAPASGGGHEDEPPGLASSLKRARDWLSAAAETSEELPQVWGAPGWTTALSLHALCLKPPPGGLGAIRKLKAALGRQWEVAARADPLPPHLHWTASAAICALVELHRVRDALEPSPPPGRPALWTAADAALVRSCVQMLVHSRNTAGAWGEALMKGGRTSPSTSYRPTFWAALAIESAAGEWPDLVATWRGEVFAGLLSEVPRGQARRGPRSRLLLPGDPTYGDVKVAFRARGFGHQRGVSGIPEVNATFAAVTTIVICRSALAGTPDLPPEVDDSSRRALDDGLAWLLTRPRIATDILRGWREPWAPGGIAIALGASGLLGLDQRPDIGWADDLLTSAVRIQEPDGSFRWPEYRGVSDPEGRRVDPLALTSYFVIGVASGIRPARYGALDYPGRWSGLDLRRENSSSAEMFRSRVREALSRIREAPTSIRDASAVEFAVAGPDALDILFELSRTRRGWLRDAAIRILAEIVGDGPEAGPGTAEWQAWFESARERLVYRRFPPRYEPL